MAAAGTLKSVTRWLKRYFLGQHAVEVAEEELLGIEDASDIEPMTTGDDLIQRILETIRLRRSVLVTGPRGCGKSFCSEQAIRLARKQNLIGGWHFLQGNREIPRDTLSEDQLIIGKSGKPEVLPALPLRPLDRDEWSNERQRRYEQHVQERRTEHPNWPWPAIPALARDRQASEMLWVADDWMVLYLDEINRFGDGFLDSLLSLTEEGKLVRGGKEYYVPMVVVATANPPGYDATAKKLSPPLQARIARSFRIAQPRFEDLVHTIIPARVRELDERYRKDPRFHLTEDLTRLAAATTLCLWGNPDSGAQGNYFLKAETREMLRQVMRRDRSVRRAMRTLSTLITFGPDARAVQDWLGFAVGLAFARQERVDMRHLVMTAVEVLGHKVRESYNEGGEPSKASLKEHCIAEVTRCVMTNPDLRELFVPPLRLAAQALCQQQDEGKLAETQNLLAQREAGLDAARRSPWIRALSRLPTNLARNELKKWRERAISTDAFTPDGDFYSQEERAWLAAVLRDLREDETAAQDVLGWQFDRVRQLEQLIAARPVLRGFRTELASTQSSHIQNALADVDDHRRWLDLLQQILGTNKLDDAALNRTLWEGLVNMTRPDLELSEARPLPNLLRLLRDSFERIRRRATAPGRKRCVRVLDCLSVWERTPFVRAAGNLTAGDGTENAARNFAALLVRNLRGPFGVFLQQTAKAPQRLSIWLTVLSELKEQPGGDEELRAQCMRAGALLKGSLFVSPHEQKFVQQMLGFVATNVPEFATRREATSQLDYTLRSARCSASELLQPHFDEGSTPQEREKQSRRRQGVTRILDELSPDDSQHFFDDFRDGSPSRSRDGLAALADLVATLPPQVRTDNVVVAYWNALHRLTFPTPGQQSGTGADRAARFLGEVLRKMPSEFSVTESLANKLTTFDDGHLARCGAYFQHPKANPPQPIGPRGMLSLLKQLVGDLAGLRGNLESAGQQWLSALAGFDKINSLAGMLSALAPVLESQNRLATYSEAAWLRLLLIQCAPQKNRIVMVKWAESVEVDPQHSVQILAASDSVRNDYLSAVVATHPECFRRGRPRALFLALTHFLDALGSSRSVAQIVREDAQSIDDIPDLDEAGETLLLTGLRAIKTPTSRVQSAIRELERWARTGTRT